ncbi:MAG: NUDIX hydrolase [Geminicoccaceae bacterium]
MARLADQSGKTTNVGRDYPDRPLVGVGAVVFDGTDLLLIKRAKPPRVGQWSLPGGAQELGETVDAAVRREVKEEAGIGIGPTRLVDIVDLIDRDPSGRVSVHYTLIDVTAPALSRDLSAGSDAMDARWFAPDTWTDLDLWDETVRVIRLAERLWKG